MRCKKLTIETDGTTEGTKIKVDGETLPSVQRFEFFADASETYSKVLVEKSMINGDGKPKTRKVRVRNLGTEKFESKDVVVTEPLPIEFEKTNPTIK